LKRQNQNCQRCWQAVRMCFWILSAIVQAMMLVGMIAAARTMAPLVAGCWWPYFYWFSAIREDPGATEGGRNGLKEATAGLRRCQLLFAGNIRQR
jgi:hypothetical protein